MIMHRDSIAADVLQAFMHSLVLATLDDKNRSMHIESRSWMDKNYQDFLLKVHYTAMHANANFSDPNYLHFVLEAQVETQLLLHFAEKEIQA